MVESIIKILNKLHNNIEKYSVKYYNMNFFDPKYEITFDYNGGSAICYQNKTVSYYMISGGIHIETTLDEIEDCEIRKLFAIIKHNCEEYTIAKMNWFANSNPTEDDEID